MAANRFIDGNLLGFSQVVEFLDDGQGSVAHGLKAKWRSMELQADGNAGIPFSDVPTFTFCARFCASFI